MLARGDYRPMLLMSINEKKKKFKCSTRKQNIIALKKNSTSRNSKINSKNARMIKY